MGERDPGRLYSFPLITGVTDGILTALTFGAGRLFALHEPVNSNIMWRLAAAASLSAGFVFFVADYARLRFELVNAERHLSLKSSSHLATTQLGRAIFYEALRGMTISGASGFFGSLFPLLVAVLWPRAPWLAMVASIAALGLLGALLGGLLYGSMVRWAAALMILGSALAAVGERLHIL